MGSFILGFRPGFIYVPQRLSTRVAPWWDASGGPRAIPTHFDSQPCVYAEASTHVEGDPPSVFRGVPPIPPLW